MSNVAQQKAILAFRRSYELFAEHCLKIQDKKGNLKPFLFNRVQVALWLMLLEDLKAGKPIRWIILKARQMGVSTWIAGLFYWIASLRSNRGCLVVAHDADSAAGLFEKQKIFYKASPLAVRPQQKLNNRMLLHFANPDNDGQIGLESRIAVDTAKNSHLGASFTIQAVHLSEYARYENINPEIKATMTSLNQAVPENPGTFVFKETTALGEGMFKDEWDDEDSIERKIFFSFIGQEEYRIETKPEDYFTLSDIEDGLYGDEEEAADFIRDQIKVWYPEWKERTPENVKAAEHETMCRLAWRRYYILHKCNRDKKAFRQEYPLTPDEAFAATGKSVFDNAKLSDHRRTLVKIRKRNESDGICNPEGFRYDVRSSDNRKRDPKWWLKSFYPSTLGPLRIFAEPQAGRKYVIGADVCENVDDSDESAAVVLLCPEMDQVGVFQGYIDPDIYAELLFAMGKLYNGALLGVEANSIGKATILRLQRLNYFPLYKREVLDNEDPNKRTHKYGWNTNLASKPTLISDLKGTIRDDGITIRDIETVNQLMSYKKLVNGDLGAAPGKKDDLVIALGIAVQMARQIYAPAFAQQGTRYAKGTMGHALKQLDDANRLTYQGLFKRF